QVLVEHLPRVSGTDAPEVEPLRQAHEVAGEAITPDVAALPHPIVLDLLAEGVVEHAPEPGAATVVLAVRADEQERMFERLARAREGELEHVLGLLELGAEELAVPLGRAAPEDPQSGRGATLATPNEEQLREPPRSGLRAEVGLDRLAERARPERL